MSFLFPLRAFNVKGFVCPKKPSDQTDQAYLSTELISPAVKMKCNFVVTASLALAALVSALPSSRRQQTERSSNVWTDLNGKVSLLTGSRHLTSKIDVISL